MKKIKFLATLCAVTLIMVSCGNKGGEREMNEYLSAFLNENPTVFMFGKADLNTLLEKVEYKSIPKYGTLIEKVKKDFADVIKTESSICYAIEGPVTNKGPKSFYGFLDVINPDELVKNLTKEGYDFEKDGDLSYTEFGDLCLGIQKDLAIIISKEDKYVPKEVLKDAFERCYGDLSEGKVNDILAQKGDIVTGISYASLFETTSKSSSIDAKALEKLKELSVDSYTDVTIRFENGAAVIESKNYFSDVLKAEMALKSDPSAKILKKLGHGDPQMGIAMNLDMVKLQSFIDKYSPQTLTQLGDQLGGPAQMALMMGGDKALSGLFTGQFGFVMINDKDNMGGMIPSFNAYLGLGEKGMPLAEMGKSFLSNGTMQAVITNDGISCYSSPNYAPASGKQLNLPDGCENFGKKGFTGFLNFEKMDKSALNMMDSSGKFLSTLKYIWIEADENGGKIYIKAKSGQENILKGTLNFFIKEFEHEMGGLAI